MKNQMEKLNEMHKQMKQIIRNQNVIMDKMGLERWQKIDGYPNYSVSTFGRVRNDKFNRILKPGTDKDGYYVVVLCNSGMKKTMKFHRIVANTFIENPEKKPCVDHIDNNRTNNNIKNLRFATIKENNQNASISKLNTSGTKGICWNKKAKKWHAKIYINGKSKHLGIFENINEAKIARTKAANKHFGEYINSCEQ